MCSGPARGTDYTLAMRRLMFCVALAIIGGTGIAMVLVLGVASLRAAALKSEAGMQAPIYVGVQALAPSLVIAGIAGFVAGAGIIGWMFYGQRGSGTGPEDGAEGDQSEV